MENRSFSKDMKGAWGLLDKRMKILMILQTGLSAGILLMLLFDFVGIVNRTVALRIDLVLLIVLLIVSALRSYPERKRSIVIYMLLLVAAIFCLVVQCFL